MDNTEMRRLFDRVLDRMVEVGWLHSYTFTVDKGYWRNWTDVGWQRKTLLRAIVESHGLVDDADAAMAFCELADGRGGRALAFEPDEEVLGLFASSVNGLNLRGREEMEVFLKVLTWD